MTTENENVNKAEKPKLAIVSTYDDLCGISGYTRLLVRQLEPHFDVTVFDLDQYFMRATHPRVRKLADKMIKDFCSTLETYDFVNIQLEHGTFGANQGDIYRRLTSIVRSAPAVSITFHTILPQPTFDIMGIFRSLGKLKFKTATQIVSGFMGSRLLTNKFYSFLRNQEKSKPVNIIVHTRRDMRLMKYVNNFANVYDHPLAFWDPESAEKIRSTTYRSSFPILGTLPNNAKIIGVFGFMSKYKGCETVVRAMHHLPENYHLVFFGGLHPNEIRQHEPINPYIELLLDEAKTQSLIFDDVANKGVTITIDQSNFDLLLNHPRNLKGRIHFLGPQTDEDFAKGFVLSDVAVLPYLEVGQTSSGVLSNALDMGARIIAARNLAFIQFSRYHPDSIELFEIGNHIELADRIMAPDPFPAEKRPRQYTTKTNTQLYISANSR